MGCPLLAGRPFGMRKGSCVGEDVGEAMGVCRGWGEEGVGDLEESQHVP